METNDQNINEYQEESIDTLESDEIQFLESVMQEAGVYMKGDLIILALGEKKEGGHAIKYVNQLNEGEHIKVMVEILKPAPENLVTQSHTYPYLLGRVSTTSINKIAFYDSETNEPLYKVR